MAKKETVKKSAAEKATAAAPKTPAKAKTSAAKGSSIKSSSTKGSSTKNSPTKGSTAKTSTAKKEAEKTGAPAGKKASPALLTTTEIGDHLAKTFDIPKSHAKIYLTETVALIARSLKKGGKVRIAGLGVFQVKKRAARKGRNPNTGEAMKIKASKRVGFTVARDLKTKL